MEYKSKRLSYGYTNDLFGRYWWLDIRLFGYWYYSNICYDFASFFWPRINFYRLPKEEI
jgi:hypothetical protein